MDREKLFEMMSSTLTRRDALELFGRTALAGIAASALPSAAFSATQNTTASGAKPNIIFILGDNHNANDMGFAGHPFIKTPGMDRLAREGVHFENNFNTTSLCSPSRASILTGAYCHKHGVLNNHTPWTGRMPTFLEHLKGTGYDTAFIGKWHMPGEGLPDMPFLDLFVSYVYREGQGAYFNCPMIVNGKPTPSRNEYITTEVTDYTTEFIDEHSSSGNPFCVYLSHRPAHPPFKSPKDLAGMYDHEDVKNLLPKDVDPNWFGKTDFNVFQGVMMGSYYDQYRKYCETITAMDRDIIRLLDHLDKTGLADNTVVIYMADNGMQWGTHGCHGIREPYEDSMRLPLIVRAPGMMSAAGTKRKQLALNIDIAPTLLDYAGVPAKQEIDGESFAPIVADPAAPGREDFLMEFWKYYPENTPSYVGVRTETHKYIEFEQGRKPWLFDIANDPGELKNLMNTEEGKKILPALTARLEEYQAIRSKYL